MSCANGANLLAHVSGLRHQNPEGKIGAGRTGRIEMRLEQVNDLSHALRRMTK